MADARVKDEINDDIKDEHEDHPAESKKRQ